MSISLTGAPALIAIILFVGLPIWIIVMAVSRVRRTAYDIHIKWDNIVKTEYQAPLDLSPAEIGYLTDSKFGKNELIATLLDLEQKGIVLLEKTNVLGYEIKNTKKQDSGLKEHEEFLLKNMFNTNDVLNLVSGNSKNFKKKVANELQKKGLIKNRFIKTSLLFSRILVFWIILNSIISMYFLISEIRVGEFGDALFFFFLGPLFLAPLLVPVSVVCGYLYHSVVGETAMWTNKMKSTWAEVQGYKLFVEQVELDNIQFESKELKNKTKIKALPYAVALGLNTDWQKRF